MKEATTHVVIGAGPAGLTAAHELVTHGGNVCVLEATEAMGGIARTVLWQGNRIDIGGHRFYTKSGEVKRLWGEMMDEPMLTVPRISRIFHAGVFFQYPLQARNVLENLGLAECLRMAASWLGAQVYPLKAGATLEDWLIHRFGCRLYERFFRSYTEKVWGMKCKEIGADWAAQRIGGLNFPTAVAQALTGRSRAKSLITDFQYPRLGPGMLWESCARKIESRGGMIFKSRVVRAVRHEEGRVREVESEDVARGSRVSLGVGSLISSMPLGALAHVMEPAPPEEVLRAARSLRYRDFLIVTLRCRRKGLFPDQWLYIHEPSVRVGRIQNFGNWSAEMLAEDTGSLLGMEYFTDRGGDFWKMDDESLCALAAKELESLGLVGPGEVMPGGLVIRQPKAYPLYDAEYRAHVAVLREYFSGFANLFLAGRNGLHRYNNQDHSMLAGLSAARRALGLDAQDPWEVCPDSDYLESPSATDA